MGDLRQRLRESEARADGAGELLRHTECLLAIAIEKLGGELVVEENQVEEIGNAGAQLVVGAVEGNPLARSFRVVRQAPEAAREPSRIVLPGPPGLVVP